MKNINQIIIFLFILIIGLVLFLLISKNNQKPDSNNNSNESIISITYHYSGTMIGDIYSYTVYQKNNKEKLKVSYTGINDDKPYVANVEKGTLANILELVKKYDVYSWNGFNESDDNVLDGYSIGLSLDFADGKTIYVSGSNTAPSGFHNFINEFTSLIKEPLDKILKKHKLN